MFAFHNVNRIGNWLVPVPDLFYQSVLHYASTERRIDVSTPFFEKTDLIGSREKERLQVQQPLLKKHNVRED